MRHTYLAIILALTFYSSKISAQCAMYPIDIEDRIASSSVIVEGKIQSQESFRDPVSGNIYTNNYIEVYKVFKGNASMEEVMMVSPGGSVGARTEEVSPSIHVDTKVTGVFFLKNSKVIGDNSIPNYQPFSGPQGCIYYNLGEGNANDVFDVYNSYEEVYALIEENLGQNYSEIKKVDLLSKKTEKSGITVITSVSPDTTVAGTKFEIVIKGREFGEVQGAGKVEFTNASTGSQWVEPSSVHYRTWSDTMIVLWVPSGAGTGALKVTQSGSGITTSPYIKFAHLNYFNFTKLLAPYHKDNDNNGGFQWSMAPSFNTDANAKNTFIRAMNTWRTGTCINWDNGSPTNIDADQEDGINIVRYAASGELPSGVLGITRNRWSNCGSNTSYTSEIDLSYDPDVNWYKGTGSPGFGQHDMESVIVHELGHAHQLGHVNNSQDFMYATLGTNQRKRDLISNNIEAGLYIMKKSVVPYDCGPDPMVALSGCTIPVGVAETSNEVSIEIYPNPFSDVLHFQLAQTKNLKISVYTIHGKLVDEIDLGSDQREYTWNVPSHLKNGLYLLRNSRDGEMIGRVMLNR